MINPETLKAWPPPVKLKRTKLAKYVRLKASVHKGLEIISPWRLNEKKILQLLEENRSWIETQIGKITEEIAGLTLKRLPTEVDILAFSERWHIQYVPSKSQRVQLIQRPQQLELVFLGNIQDKSACIKLLIRWVKTYAREMLGIRLAELSKEVRLPFKGLTIRNQKSRWGSCSHKKSISLNYKLMFLPPLLCDHILLHELCHTKHFNHSADFWNLLKKLDPKFEKHRIAYNEADVYIPKWTLTE